ncbi:MAG: DEAD/DEAH box helicase [Paludibacter sp.]|nr:DEAD/DEAH box helicase [Paludibacter sp.]
MPTLDKQIAFYNQLTENEKLLIKAFALVGSFNYLDDISAILQYKIKITQKTVKEWIAKAIYAGVLTTSERSYSWDEKKYKISIPFMAYIYRELEGFDTEWTLSQEKNVSFYYINSSNELSLIRKFLYEMLYKKEVATAVQNAFISNANLLHKLDISNYHEYLKNINKLDIALINSIILHKTSYFILQLLPLNQINDFKEKFTEFLEPSKVVKLTTIENNLDFFAGNFGSILQRGTSENHIVVSAIHFLVNGDVENAIKLFDQQLKLMRKEHKGIQVFPNFAHNFFYFAALLCLNSDETTARAQKMLIAYSKTKYNIYDNNFKAVLYNILNNKEERENLKNSFYINILNLEEMNSLFLFALAYLADLTPLVKAKDDIIRTIQKGIDAGNLVFTYEAAYVADKWFGTPETAELYRQIATLMSYQPICSMINRQEEWEKSLNLLFSAVGSSKSAKATNKTSENNARVIYLFTPKHTTIQPVLQTRNAKGEWSKGRNIAMKTFFEGKTQGMTEQDFKISKTIKYYKGGYYNPDSYEFTQKAIVELIGHPYLYLAGANEIPMELVAAQPEISVAKKNNGYALSSNIKDFTSGIFIEKETNTRYKVYDLNNNQINLIRILTQQNVVVPEQGKEKLIQLLGGISKFANVHSDLLSTSTQSNINVRTIDPDNRIRVQLLPFGDGLKAELFAKPFGSFPPYCKPGVGGKMLITNNKGEQLQVKRNLAAEIELSNIILNDIQQLDSVNMSDELIAFDEPLDSLHLLDVLALHKDKCVVEWPEGERFKIRATAGFANLNMQIKSKNNWFEVDGELKVDEDTVISLQQLMALVAKSHDRFIELKNGEFLALSHELKKRLEELYTFSTHGKNGLNINKFASVAMGNLFDDVENLKTDKAWKDFRNRIETQSNIDAKIPTALQAELRPYQEEGYRWMARLAEWEGGACLADDMGLGKTVQTLAVLLHRASKGPALVVCPVSVVGNWISEAQRFAPSLNVKMLENSNRQEALDELGSGDVLVTSYGLLQSEEKLFIEKEFATVVLDEAHIIKNYATKTSKATMQLKAGFRLALTGTPLQNHQGEIWNLFNFINPGLLGSLAHFTDTFIKPDNDYSRKLLRKLIRPFILRRTKTAVLDELPPKTEIIKKIQLSEAEMAFYEALRRQAILNLESEDGNQGTKHLRALAEITKLRQASCNPLLVDSTIGIESSKLATFLDIADELIDNNHRALVFSQFVSHLSIVRQALDKKGITYQYLDGSTPMAERERNVKNFQNGEGQLFLISLKAGGLGLNLTAADFVIHLDPWWNPAVEDQASDRAHRIGQKRPVTIYRLVAENTIEEKIIKLHNTKRGLAESLLEGSDQSAKMSFNELVSLIQESI